MTTQTDTAKNTKLTKFLNGIEKAGNKLPDPFMLFIILAVIVIIASWIISSFGVTFTQPGENEEVAIQSLVSAEGLQYMLTSMMDNFVGFTPLGIVLTMMLGIGLANKVGLLETLIKNTILQAPKQLVTYAVIFTGILGNLAADAAFIIVPPLAAMVFYNVGRHPLAGLAAGFAGVGSGFTANIIVTNTDAVLSGISAEVMGALNTNVTVTPVDNWFFMIASTLLLTVTGALITEKIVEPRLGKYEGNANKEFEPTKPIEKRALRNAAIAAIGYIGLLLLVLFLPNSPLRSEDGGMIPSPFLDGIVPIIMLFFVTTAVAYGTTTKKIENSRSIAKMMGDAIKDMSGFIVLVFAAAQFIAYFEWTNIGSWLAVSGATFLESADMTGIGIVIAFILLTALLNLLIFSGSALWALEAPVFLQMFYFLGYHPAFIQVAYRIADSSTSVVTPMNPYFIIVLAFMQEYDKKAGLGTLMALMLPYALIFLTVWILLLLAFVFLGLPFGPGIGVYL
ncbi:AbgT family transporter [Virgibacillus sp. NKC19-16]|uniref:AbgT family transporter n=1 Tax=Virgibacillus salidurans TaxID=2831673 RepID=UPI001F35B047|nr:AbgT family transporter [Virgibacillus sp. NKC19-16]UJL46333.1 AbgT family transporter [Virgibacillus sp. NKC19-16]